MVTRQRNVPAVWVYVILAVLGGPAAWADEVLHWSDMAQDIMQQSVTEPTRASRTMAIVQSAVYDAVNAVNPTHAPIFYLPAVTGPASQEAAAAAAAYSALVGLYPDYAASLEDELAKRLAAIPNGPAKDNGVAIGMDVAERVLAARASDGSDAGYVYVGSTAVGRWRPTPPDVAPGADPHWGNVEPFVIPSSDAFLPAPPPALDSAQYAAAVNEVQRLGGAASAERTAEQTEIALFWLDVPGPTASPAAKWDQVAQVLGEQQGNTPAENARMLALVNLAMADAAIVAWDAKYTYESWRPEDAIHLADLDGNPDTLADPEWTPLYASPAFPEYVSGHSTFGGAAAEVLASFFGTDGIEFTMTAGYGILPDVTRTFESISEAALENAVSRIYAGVHFSFASTAGLESGGIIGEYVFNNVALPIPAPAGSILVLIGTACLLNWRPRV